MQLGLIHRERIRAIDPALEEVFDDIISTISATFGAEHDAQGRHTNISVNSVTTIQNNSQQTTPSAVQPFTLSPQDGLWLKRGPFLLDDTTANNPDIAGLRPPKIATGTYNNYEPSGVGDAFLIELEPDGGTVTLTGLKARGGIAPKRLIVLRNRDSSVDLVLVHESTSSQAPNRFDLPSSTDVTLGPGESAWLYYDPNRNGGRWTFIITTQTSGGTGALVVGGGNVVQFASLSVTDAQIKTLNSVPLEIVAAPGSGKVIIPLWWYLRRNTAGGAYSANPSFHVRYGTAGTDSTLFGGVTIALTVAADNANYRSSPDTTAVVGVDLTNNGLNVKTSADVTGGNAANTLKVSVAYYVHDMN